VLSTPNATSPIGFSLVSTSLLVSAPASPDGRTSSVSPVSFSNFFVSFLGRLNDSCVTRTTVDPGSALAFFSSDFSAASVQLDSASAVMVVTAAAVAWRNIPTPFAGANRIRS